MPDELRSPIKHHLVLHRIDPDQGVRRFYSLMIERDLFGTVRLKNVQSRHLMDRIKFEAFGFLEPGFADELVGCEPFEGLEPSSEVVGVHEVSQMLPELVMAVVVVALDRRVLDGAVHPLNLTIGPGMSRLGQAMVHIVLGTGILKGMGSEKLASFHGFLDQRDRRSSVAGRGEVNAMVSQDRVHLLRHGLDQRAQEVAGNPGGHLLVQLHERELVGAVNPNQRIEPFLLSEHFGNVDMTRRAASAKVADGMGLELLLGRLVAGHLGQAADAMPLQATMER